jgi:hypothetical protein
MSDIDEKKPTGKAGKRKRNAEQRNRKSEQKQQPKADQLHPVNAKAETIVTAPEPLAVAEQAVEAQADTTIMAAEAVPAAVQEASEPAALPTASVETAPVAAEEIEQQPHVMVATADALPVVSPYVSEPPAPAMASVESVELAPVAAPEVKEQTVTTTPPEVVPETAPVSVTHVPVSLQTIANAYGDYTRKSLEQTQCFIDKLTGVRTLDQVVEVQTEFAKQACETFGAEAQKIHDLHRELARQRFERLEGLMSMGTQASRSM